MHRLKCKSVVCALGAGAAQPQPAATAAPDKTSGTSNGADPLFDTGESLVNSSGARVVFTTAAASKLEPVASMRAALHVWETL